VIDKEGLKLKKPIEKLSDSEFIIELDNIPDKIGILEKGDISLLKEHQLGYIVMKNPPKDKELQYIEYSKFYREKKQQLIVNLDNLIKHLKTYISLYYRGEKFFLDEERFPQRYWIIPDAYTRLKEWIKEPNIPYCFILGDYGVGKTFLCRMFSLHIHTKAKKGEKDISLPLYIDMANIRLDQGIYLKDILGRYIHEYLDLPGEYVDTLLEMVKRGRVILVFDGFDEHATHLKYKDAGVLLRELRRGAQDTGKVIIACRTHYFEYQEEEKRKLKGEDTILAREVIKPESTLVIHLSEFTQEEIKQYISRMLGEQKMDSVYQLIQKLHDLPDLAKRPILLNLIIRVLPQIEQLVKKKDKISAADLYELLIKEWVYRDENKHFIKKDIKIRFMEEVAWRLWNTKSFDINLSDLGSWLREYLLRHNYPTDWEIAQIDIRTATFLSRDEEGRYRFIHRSFEEFFLARRIKEGLSNAESEVLDIPRLSVEIVRFVLDLLDSVSEDKARELIEKILEGEDYTSLQKENSFLILSIWNRHKAKKISPKRLKLSHLNLSGMDLSGIDLSEAELSYANLSYANLQNAILKKADLSFAKLDEANLFQADLSYANLNNASLKRAKLIQADLSCAKLNNADLSASLFTSSNLQYADISNTRLVSSGFVNADLLNTKIDGSYPKNARFLCARLTDNQAEYLKERGADLPKSIKELKINTPPPADSILSVAFSPDDTLIASASGNNIVLWDREGRFHIATLIGHTDIVNSLCFSHDGRILASGSFDNTIRLWDVEKRKEIGILRGHEGWVNFVCFSPDGKMLVSGSSDETIRLWDVESREEIGILRGHKGCVNSVSFSPDGKILASGSFDCTIRLWDVEKRSEIGILRGHESSVYSVCFSQDGRILASGSFDKTIRLWDVEKRSEIGILRGHEGSIYSVSFSPDGRILASGYEDYTIRLGDDIVSFSGDAVKLLRYTHNLASYSYDEIQAVRVGYERYKEFLSILLDGLKSEFGRDFILSYAVFGSVARGDANPMSDIDLLVVVKERSPELISRFVKLLFRLKKEDVYLNLKRQNLKADPNPIFLTQEELKENPLILLDVLDDGKVIYDTGVLEERFDYLRKRLKELGSKKVRLPNGKWYWDLKPDWKPGEIVKL
jgi:WD40 repeat protein/predicted nucleotidyltransferase